VLTYYAARSEESVQRDCELGSETAGSTARRRKLTRCSGQCVPGLGLLPSMLRRYSVRRFLSCAKWTISFMWPRRLPWTRSWVRRGSSAAKLSDSIALSVSRSFSRCCSSVRAEASVILLDVRSRSVMFGHTVMQHSARVRIGCRWLQLTVSYRKMAHTSRDRAQPVVIDYMRQADGAQVSVARQCTIWINGCYPGAGHCASAAAGGLRWLSTHAACPSS
jgi:hypothetical protein